MIKPKTYKSSGVNIAAADAFVKAIQKDVKSTHGKGVISRKGSFGGLFALDKKQVLVSSTDGVGTKLLIAQQLGVHDTVGIDLVAMNVNDILCVGAKPLFFLDYIACGKLTPKVLQDVVKGIAEGCRQSKCSLIAGETAEMPDMYKPHEYDLAGFCVGVVEKSKILDGSKIKAGNVILGFPSSGIHSNGYSLVRKAFSKSELRVHGKEILAPTKIYTKEVETLLSGCKVNGIAHNTGGAWFEKLTKVLPKGLCFEIEKGTWPIPKIFQILQKKGRIEDLEMYKTFNMGIGLICVLSAKEAVKAQALLKKKRIKSYQLGKVIKHSTLLHKRNTRISFVSKE